jgi:DNA-directed RNA polymerase subunit RPC12/RpoP
MELRICPVCNKAFYSSSDRDGVLCTHCGYVLYEVRVGARVELNPRSLCFTLSLSGEEVRASLKDYSPSGLRIIYSGKTMPVDTVCNVDIDELGIHAVARTVWSKKISSSSVSAGLRLIN